MNRRKIALRALKNLCAFIGAIALFSYFYNFTVDLRHWYVTLASALACALLWFGFCIIELHAGGVAHLSRSLARAASGWLAALRVRQLTLDFPQAAEPPREMPAVSGASEPPRPAPTLPFLRPPDPHPPA